MMVVIYRYVSNLRGREYGDSGLERKGKVEGERVGSLVGAANPFIIRLSYFR